MESISSSPRAWASPEGRSALTAVLRALESALPGEEVLHSLHAQALKNPELKSLPAMDLFTEAGLDHLHAMVATAGFIRRILSGDSEPATWSGLQSQLLALHPSHVAAGAAFQEMMQSEAAQHSETLQTLRQVLEVVNQAHHAVMTAVQPLATIDVGGANMQGESQISEN
jgi:hypothetical protein